MLYIDSLVLSVGEKCPNMEFSWSVFPRIWIEYGKIRTRKISVFGHFSHSVDLHAHILT